MKYNPSIAECQYDDLIKNTIPFYDEILEQIADVIVHLGLNSFKLLDIGCGTGNLIKLIDKKFTGCQITLCDASVEMLALSKNKLSLSKKNSFKYVNKSAEKLEYNNQFDIITSVHLNHFFKDQSVLLKKIYNALKPGGLLLSVQNTAPNGEHGMEITLSRWMGFLVKNGRNLEEAKNHIGRYGTDYFPLTVNRQKEVLCEAGFKEPELFWHSYIQTGIYAVKNDV